VVRPEELAYLRRVAHIFGFDAHAFERIRATHMDAGEQDPYEVLGVTLVAQGMPQEFIDVATEKVAIINAAYDRVRERRGGPEPRRRTR
jgi:DnaJ like chaperone protein